MRFFIASACLIVAALHPIAPHAQSPAACSIGGTITSARTPLPGVVISALGADGRAVDVSASGVDGAYALKIPGPGRYTLKAEFVAFAPLSREVTVDQTSCQARLDITMTLASRVPQTAATTAAVPTTADVAPNTAAPAVAGRRSSAPAGPQGGRGQAGGRGQGAGAAPRGQAFQSLTLVADDAGLARSEDAGASDAAAQLLLPPGFSPDTSAESVTSIGNSRANEGFLGPNGSGDFAQRFANFGGDGTPGGAVGPGGAAGFAFPGGFAGGRGFGPSGPFGRGGRGNQIRGTFFQSVDSSILD
ncbi:MAG: carboxypeptidase regulatory-like domain-containing protein, partial [Vicinamibacterales bacterium]